MSAQHTGPSGAELAARRKAKGWTQRQLAEAAGIGRSAVQYWERAKRIDTRGWAVRRIVEALGWDAGRGRARDELLCQANTPARGDGLIALGSRIQAMIDAQIAAFKEREAERAARRRVRCGAKTRKGTACRNKSEPGKRRCKFHGGMSTGARTPEGIERIREAQRRRWAKAKDC